MKKKSKHIIFKNRLSKNYLFKIILRLYLDIRGFLNSLILIYHITSKIFLFIYQFFSFNFFIIHKLYQFILLTKESLKVFHKYTGHRTEHTTISITSFFLFFFLFFFFFSPKPTPNSYAFNSMDWATRIQTRLLEVQAGSF